MWIPDCPKIQEAYRLGMLQVPEEMEFMCAFVAWKRPKVIMEIGACYGASMMLWCQYGKPELAISLDMAVPKDGRSDVNYEKRKELFKFLNVTELQADSHTMAAVQMTVDALKGRTVDMLVIDGDHSYEGVFADFLMYRKFLSPNGFVLFHDVLRSEYHDGLSCAAAHVYQRLTAKLKVTVIGNGNGGGGWGLWYPWGGKFLPEEDYAKIEKPKEPDKIETPASSVDQAGGESRPATEPEMATPNPGPAIDHEPAKSEGCAEAKGSSDGTGGVVEPKGMDCGDVPPAAGGA